MYLYTSLTYDATIYGTLDKIMMMTGYGHGWMDTAFIIIALLGSCITWT